LRERRIEFIQYWRLNLLEFHIDLSRVQHVWRLIYIERHDGHFIGQYRLRSDSESRGVIIESVHDTFNGGQVRTDSIDAESHRLDDLSFAFDVSAPEDATIQNELTAMGAEERGKQALYIMVMKTYLGTGPIGGGGGGVGKLNMGSALNSVLSSQINSLMGNLKNASVSVGIEDHDLSDTGGKRTDYSFRYSQRLFNNRFQIVIGGKVSTGENATNNAESFIDNISLEYRLDRTGTRYVRLFYDKNYESVLEGEITETGVGLVLRKKLDKLSELFIFKKKK